MRILNCAGDPGWLRSNPRLALISLTAFELSFCLLERLGMVTLCLTF